MKSAKRLNDRPLYFQVTIAFYPPFFIYFTTPSFLYWTEICRRVLLAIFFLLSVTYFFLLLFFPLLSAGTYCRVKLSPLPALIFSSIISFLLLLGLTPLGAGEAENGKVGQDAHSPFHALCSSVLLSIRLLSSWQLSWT